MIFKNIYLSDGSCVIKKKKYYNTSYYLFDIKNSKYWNVQKNIQKNDIVSLFKNKFLKRK